MMLPRLALITILLMATATLPLVGGCFPKRYNAAKATRPYPAERKQGKVVAVQVTRDGDEMVLVNGTAIDFRDFDLWLNQRYLQHVERFAPGETKRIPLGEFWDVWAGGPNPGGLLRWYDPTPIVLVQAQIDEDGPLIGFLSIPGTDELER